ncbi:MAG: ATP-binding protein [Halolamina sp.]
MTLSTASDALEALGDLYFAVGADDRLQEWNDAVSRVTGHGDALAERTVADLLVCEGVEAVTESLDAAREQGEATVEAELATADGSSRPYEMTFVDIGDGAVAALGRDISQRREQRNAMQNRERVLRGMYDVMSDTDRSFEEQVEALLLLGRTELGMDYGTLSRIDGADYLFEVVHADDDSVQAGDVVPVSDTYCELVATDEQSLVLGDIEADAAEETDRTGYQEWGVTCYLGAPVLVEGEVYGTFCFYDTEPRSEQFSAWHVTLVDLMSRWVSYELQRRRDHEQLRRQNEQLDGFAAIVSHDLRNPLNVLQGSLELAAETGEAEHFERAERAVDRMETLIDDLLVLARAGDAIEATEAVDLGALARQCWKGVDTENADLAVEARQTIQADQTRLRQLLENLIRNAIEHAPGEEGVVTVTIGDLDDGFYVADDGVGIPEDDRERVFDSGFSTRSEGTGFGLSIVTEIAEGHGWSIDVTESENGGARFAFTGVEIAEEARESATE